MPSTGRCLRPLQSPPTAATQGPGSAPDRAACQACSARTVFVRRMRPSPIRTRSVQGPSHSAATPPRSALVAHRRSCSQESELSNGVGETVTGGPGSAHRTHDPRHLSPVRGTRPAHQRVTAPSSSDAWSLLHRRAASLPRLRCDLHAQGGAARLLHFRVLAVDEAATEVRHHPCRIRPSPHSAERALRPLWRRAGWVDNRHRLAHRPLPHNGGGPRPAVRELQQRHRSIR